MRQSQTEEAQEFSGEDFLDDKRKVTRIAALTAEFAADGKGAAELIRSGLISNKGNQSTLALRLTFAAAAAAYCKIFGKPPDSSRDNYGVCGKFVLAFIERIPETMRPNEPSASAIDGTVKDWKQRLPAAFKATMKM